ncbi:MAG TPA: hypothetical protein VNW15_14410 [Rhizomicrobium sp.]|nr:hypothetical protein [Rhizomicrobium sp.]
MAILGTVVIMVIGGLSYLLPFHWWMRSGMSVNPGNFIARQPINYPVCEPWDEKAADFARSDLQVTDGVSQEPIAAGDQTTLGIVLPAKARIIKVYCATGLVECSYLGCSPPLSLQATDAVYSRGRVFSLAIEDKASRSSPVNLRVWVVWK